MIDDTVINNKKEEILKKVEKVKEEHKQVRREVVEFELKNHESLSDLMFMIIPVRVDWDKFNFESEEIKSVKIADVCKELIAMPVTITHNDIDDYGQPVIKEVPIGAITKVSLRPDDVLSIFAAIWITPECTIEQEHETLHPTGVHIDIDFDLNKAYIGCMQKQKKITQKIEKIVCETLGIENIEQNKDKLQDLGYYMPKRTPKFQEFLDNEKEVKEKEENNE